MLMAFASVLTLERSATLAFSGHSSFWGSRTSPAAAAATTATLLPSNTQNAAASLVMYENSHDQPSSPKFNAWHVLSNTEAWLSKTLESANADATTTGGSSTNPYTRKEVSYQCEPATTGPMIVSNIFRRLKDARELGQKHGVEYADVYRRRQQQQQQLQGTEDRPPPTLRQTQVIVVPGHEQLTNSFSSFDKLVNAINQARRNARDYVTATVSSSSSSDDEDDDDDDDDEMPWSVAVNCAHLHPKFGEKTPQQRLQELKEEEEAGEVDLNYKEYLEKKNKARQSPYPTIVIEVRATPPPDFGQSPPPSAAAAAAANNKDETAAAADGSVVTAEDIQKLEALFGKSAHLAEENPEDAFYDALGQSINKVDPLQAAQEWIAANDPNVQLTAAFTESDTTHVDEAYQFVFTNVAMMMEDVLDKTTGSRRKYYLVLPQFLSMAATSLDKFTMEMEHMLHALPDVGKKVQLTTFHPEHIDPNKRAPCTILSMEWIEEGQPSN